MKINLLERPELIHGAVELKSTGTAVYPVRFSDKLLWAPKAPTINECSAGIRLQCRTDAQYFYGKFQLGPRSWEFGRGEFDLFIDGQGVSTFTPLPPWDEEQIFEINQRLPEGTHELLLYFPAYSKTGVLELELGGASSVEAVASPERKILFFGDSITQGYAATASQGYAAQLARIFHAEYLNLSVSGGQMPRRVPAALGQEKFDLAVVSMGVNDGSWLRDAGDFRAAVAGVLQIFAANPQHRVVIIQPINWPRGYGIPGGDRVNQFRQIIAEEAALYPQNVLCVNGLELVPPHGQLYPDGLHLNAAGMRFYAANLSGKIAPWLNWKRDDKEL